MFMSWRPQNRFLTPHKKNQYDFSEQMWNASSIWCSKSERTLQSRLRLAVEQFPSGVSKHQTQWTNNNLDGAIQQSRCHQAHQEPDGIFAPYVPQIMLSRLSIQMDFTNYPAISDLYNPLNCHPECYINILIKNSIRNWFSLEIAFAFNRPRTWSVPTFDIKFHSKIVFI